MSGKLDQSLDDILSTRRKAAGRRGRGRRVPTGTRVVTAAPSGGIQKNVKNTRGATRAAAPNGPAAGSGDSKIIVSNLVRDADTLSQVIQPLIPLALRCQRSPDQGMLKPEATVLDISRRFFHPVRFLRRFSIVRTEVFFQR